MDDYTIDALIVDRLRCIEPHLRSELLSALGHTARYSAPQLRADDFSAIDQSAAQASHAKLSATPLPFAKRRRDVAAHPRQRSAHLMVSALDDKQLSFLQRGHRKNKTDASNDVMDRLSSLEAQVVQLQVVQNLSCAAPGDYFYADPFNAHFLEALAIAQGAEHTRTSAGSNNCSSLNPAATEFIPDTEEVKLGAGVAGHESRYIGDIDPTCTGSPQDVSDADLLGESWCRKGPLEVAARADASRSGARDDCDASVQTDLLPPPGNHTALQTTVLFNDATVQPRNSSRHHVVAGGLKLLEMKRTKCSMQTLTLRTIQC